MKITADENGIIVKKLFKSEEIPYKEITKITIEGLNRCVIKTRSGEEYVDTVHMGITFNYPVVMDKIVQLGIAFEDKFIVSDFPHKFIDELNKQEYVDTLVAAFEPEAREIIKTRLGERHDISLEVMEIHRDTVLCMRLLRDGVEVTDYPDSYKDYDDVKIREAFDTETLLILTEWDPLSRSGKYIVGLDDEEAHDEKAALIESVNDFCDDYLEVNSREYLDAL